MENVFIGAIGVLVSCFILDTVLLEIRNLRKHEGFMSYLRRFYLLNPFHKGLLLNGLRDRLSLKNSFIHSLVVARTGGGKTSSFIIPNILIADNCSILTTDLSGELYEKTSGKMKEKGFNIVTINLIEPQKSSRFNPLASLETDQEILEVAEVLISSGNQNSKDPFWDNGAKTLLFIVITCLVNQKRKEGTSEFCNLPNVRFLLNNFWKMWAGLQSFIEKYADLKTLHEWKGFISGSEKTTQGFVSTALNSLAIVGSDVISKITASNEIDFNEIRTQKTIVYLMIPQHELTTYSFLLNLFYTRFFKTCYTNKQHNTLPVYCLLDEAGHTQIPHLATIITTIRKYKVSISLILQSLSQLKTAYGEAGARTILEWGVASKIFYGGCDHETCETLSRILGNVATSHANYDGKTQNLIRPLMTPQAIRMMSDRHALYLFSNKKPTILRLKPYYKHFTFNRWTKIKAHDPISREFDEVKYVNLEIWSDMRNEEITQQSLDIQAPQEVEVVQSFWDVRNSQEIIAQMIYDNKKKVQKIMIKPKFFKCRDYIMESTKYSVDRVLKGYSKGIKFQKGETYTQYVKRIRGKK